VPPAGFWLGCTPDHSRRRSSGRRAGRGPSAAGQLGSVAAQQHPRERVSRPTPPDECGAGGAHRRQGPGAAPGKNGKRRRATLQHSRPRPTERSGPGNGRTTRAEQRQRKSPARRLQGRGSRHASRERDRAGRRPGLLPKRGNPAELDAEVETRRERKRWKARKQGRAARKQERQNGGGRERSRPATGAGRWKVGGPETGGVRANSSNRAASGLAGGGEEAVAPKVVGSA